MKKILKNCFKIPEIVVGDYNGDNMDDIYCYENGTTSVSTSVLRRKLLNDPQKLCFEKNSP